MEMLVEKNKIAAKIRADDWQDAIRKAGQLLIDSGDIKEGYIDHMIDSVRTLGPYMVIAKGFALAHAAPRMCFERGLRYEDNNEEGIYEWLLDWFNDLGICFSYHKNTNSQRLDNYELLNPQWLTRAAYVLINKGKEDQR